MSKFNLANCKLEVLSELPTEICYKCPSCGGKLKYKKLDWAYLCVTENCSTAQIRTALGLSSSSGIITPSTLVIKQPTITKFDELMVSPPHYQLAKQYQIGDRHITYFSYSDEFIVERVDYDDEQPKQLFPKYRVGNKWIYGRGKNTSLFNQRYITNGSVLIAEGEKCADIVSSITGWLTLSPPSFGWSNNYLIAQLSNPHITGIIYLPDNDKIGRVKSDLIKYVAWSLGKPFYVVPLDDVTSDDGGDIADLANTHNIKELLYARLQCLFTDAIATDTTN